jgi:hypothetical protein
MSHIRFLIAKQLLWMMAFKWLLELFTCRRSSSLILKKPLCGLVCHRGKMGCLPATHIKGQRL